MKKREKVKLIAGIAGITIAILMLLGLIVNEGMSWSGCDLALSNSTDQTVIYNVEWLDHNIKEYQGFWVTRCSGELKAGATYRLSDFLGIGRHRITWHGNEQSLTQHFTVDADSTIIELSIKHW